MRRASCAGIGLSTALLATSGLSIAAELPSQEEMWRIIQEQQREIEALKKGQKTTEEKAEAAVEMAEQSRDTTSTTASWAERTQIGGYGELHYNNLDTDDGRKKEIDFHRFVLFFGHQFTDRLRFWSELELEHAISGDGEDGEIELEQAYIEYDLTPSQHVKGGLFLIPVGILNETHEPPTFYGVERNPVERNIIPTTWWAGGAELTGEIAPGWSYNFGVHEGLETDSYNIRSGRQKTSEADAHDLASTARVKWNGIAGVELAATVQYQENITQGLDNDASAWLYEAHADIQRGPLGLRALYARWDIDGDGARAAGRDEQDGFYVEPSYKLLPEFGVFVRYSQWDNEAGSSSDSEKKQYNAGFNYWPHPDVVLKADYQKQDNEGNVDEEDGINLGIGYQF
ncbi:MAG: porin [Gammaproteobacteria bacterium]|nr:MAG: porin [Gammaproteobacteria bacterium]